MASSAPAVPRQNPNTMRRTAPAAGSRIPQLQRKDETRHVSAPHRSRLQDMQDSYQRKLLKEKEEKMLAIYNKQQKQQEQALQRVQRQENGYAERQGSGQGIVRDFFRERRELENSKGSANLLSRDKHFQKKLIEKKRTSNLNSRDIPSQNSEFEDQRRYEERKENEMQNYKKQWQQNQSSPQHGQGVVRSKPLAPIKHAAVKRNDKPQPAYNHYETSSNLMDEEEDDYDDTYAKPPSKPQKVSHRSKPAVDDYDEGSQRRGEQVRTMNLKKAAPPIARGKPEVKGKKEKMSDFQKWQAEQDQERNERLKRHEQKQSKQRANYDVDYDQELEQEKPQKTRQKSEYDEMLAKERELEAQIAKRKADLEKMQQDYDDGDDIATPPPQKTKTKSSFRSKQKPSQKPARDFNEDTGVSPYQDPTRTDYESRAGEFKNNKPKRTSKASYDDMYEEMPPPPYHNPTQEDYESRAGEFKSRKKQAPAKPRAKPKRPVQEDEESVPPYKPTSPVAYDTTFYEQAGADETGDIRLVPCSNCGRNFAEDRLAKHMKICKTAGKKKRKVFDTTKQRTQGTELEQYVKKGNHLKNEPKVKPNNWRSKHQDFQRAIRDARETQAYIAKGGKLSDLPPPPPAENPDYKQCPYCERRFNPTTAERHIPKCKDIKNRPKPLRKK